MPDTPDAMTEQQLGALTVQQLLSREVGQEAPAEAHAETLAPSAPEAPTAAAAAAHPTDPRLSPEDDNMPDEMRREFFPPLRFARIPGTEKPGGAAVESVLKMPLDELKAQVARGEPPSGAVETFAAMRDKLRAAGVNIDERPPSPPPSIAQVLRRRVANSLGVVGEAAETTARHAGPITKVGFSLLAELCYAGQELLDRNG